MCLGEPVAENRLEQLECMKEVAADVLKTALAQREREACNSVKAPGGDGCLRQCGLRLVRPPRCDEVVGQLGHVREAQGLG